MPPVKRPDLIFGIHSVTAALEAGEAEALWLVAERRDQRLDRLRDLASQQGVPVQEWGREELTRRLGTDKHQGVAASLRPLPQASLDGMLAAASGHPPLVLALDGVQDPHNLGACLRSAEGAGVDGVLLPKDNACPVNATVRKVSVGSASRVPVISVTNLSRTLEDLKERGLWIVGMAGEGEQILYDLDLTMPLVLVLGGEERGMRRLTRDHCDFLARIPMMGKGASLNVSVAAAVALFEARRQRMHIAAAETRLTATQK